MNRAWRIASRVVAVLAAVGALLLLAAWLLLRGSLPRLDGRAAVPGLGAEVRVERDALGIPTIRGATREDVARATGFVHAQDRFFQMDLGRRFGAGEVSALLGPVALGLDRAARRHRFRARAEEALRGFDPGERALLEAYAEGVNAGLRALRVRPFEYLVLRQPPAPWRPEDALLVAFSMFLELQPADGRRERSREAMREVMSPELHAFFTRNGSAWSARIDGSADPILPVPGPEFFRMRRGDGGDFSGSAYLADRSAPAGIGTGGKGARRAAGDDAEAAFGSNNWAVAGFRSTRGGGAIVANDTHLSLRNLPVTWYRARLVVEREGQTTLDVCGVTLPGLPVLAVGSNGRIAWGVTTSNVDVADVVVVEPEAGNPDRYVTPEGSRPFVRHEERIEVRGAEPEILVVEETVWGPMLPGEPPERRRLALAWIAHDPSLVNLGAVGLETAADVEAAVAIAARAWFPSQNLVVGDRSGRIAWTLLGPVPERTGFDGTVPVSMSDGARSWRGALGPEAWPARFDPADGRLWTANGPVVGGDEAARLGDGGMRHDGRAFQIRERLRSAETFDELSLFAIQMDAETFFLRRWQGLLLEILDAEALAADGRRAGLRAAVEAWPGGAYVDAVGHALVRQFRLEAAEAVLGRLLAPCRERFPGCRHADFDFEEPLWLLVSGRPEWAAAPGGWRGELLGCADRVMAEGEDAGGGGNFMQPWGQNNRLDLAHPLARAFPFARRWLGAPRVGLAGDSYAPNALRRGHGPVKRMVVAPGREASGVFHMPGGQSGHPLSPYFLAGHEAWARGEATTFLPGATAHRLVLAP